MHIEPTLGQRILARIRRCVCNPRASYSEERKVVRELVEAVHDLEDEPMIDLPPRPSEQVTVKFIQGSYRPHRSVEDPTC